MGCEELIRSLRKEAEEKVRKLWKETEEEAGGIRAGVALRLEVLRLEEIAGHFSEEERVRLLLEADRRAKKIRLISDDRLSARLYSLSVSSLRLLREKGYENIFSKLALELPHAAWHTVKVNPDDSDLARKRFPNATIVADTDITGGMEAEAEEGRVRVSNTFEKRLQGAWQQMLPALMDDIYRKVLDEKTTGAV